MSTRGLETDRSRAGFSLVELLVALVLMGLVLAALGMITAQWLPNWRRGLERLQGDERLALALDRIAADLRSAEFVPAERDIRLPLFYGTSSSVTFVRTALGPSTRPGLEIVQIGETPDPDGVVLTRRTARYVPRPAGAEAVLGDPVVLLRPPYRVAFSFAGADGIWQDAWEGGDRLPRAVRIVVRDGGGRALAASTAVVVRAELPAICALDASQPQCRSAPPGGAP